MRPAMKQAIRIFRKDVRHLWPSLSIVLVVQILFTIFEMRSRQREIVLSLKGQREIMHRRQSFGVFLAHGSLEYFQRLFLESPRRRVIFKVKECQCQVIHLQQSIRVLSAQ